MSNPWLLFLQMVPIVLCRFPPTAEPLMCMWEMGAALTSTAGKVNKQENKEEIHDNNLLDLLNHFFVIHRGHMRAGPLLAESRGGAQRGVGGDQPRGYSEPSRKQHERGPNHSHW